MPVLPANRRADKSGLGASIAADKESFKSLEAAMLDAKGIDVDSGRQEMLESIIDQHI